MPSSRFDIATVGGGLAVRMTAALLAKQGKRVLHLTAACPHDPWPFSSPFLRKTLDILGGQECLEPTRPFQVLSPVARVTVHPGVPLADELHREFGNQADTVARLLADLEATGNRLEELLWEHGGLPGEGVRELARWRWLCLRRKLPTARLDTPLAGTLRALTGPAAEWLTDLFQGLAMQPVAALSVADGALLWAHARQPGGVAVASLLTLLQKRFEQFHGRDVELADLATLEFRNGKWFGTLHSGGGFEAEQLILGDTEQELPGCRFALPRCPLTPPQQLVSSALDGQLSPLLERQVIAGGSLPLRLTIAPAASATVAQISASALADEAGIRRQLEPVLPFADYTLQILAQGRSTIRLADPAAVALPYHKLPLQLGSRLWCVDAARLLPQLGNGGAALLAWTLVREVGARAEKPGN